MQQWNFKCYNIWGKNGNCVVLTLNKQKLPRVCVCADVRDASPNAERSYVIKRLINVQLSHVTRRSPLIYSYWSAAEGPRQPCNGNQHSLTAKAVWLAHAHKLSGPSVKNGNYARFITLHLRVAPREEMCCRRTGGQVDVQERMNIAQGAPSATLVGCEKKTKNPTQTSGANWHPSLLSVYVTSQLTSARQWPSTCLCMVPQRCHKTWARSFARDDRVPGALPPGPNFPLWKWIARP